MITTGPVTTSPGGTTRRGAAPKPPAPVKSGLPGADLIEQGLADLADHRDTVPALLVSIGAPRLRGLGIAVPAPIADPEHRLYELLQAEDQDAAHSRYNAWIRRLVSFERAAACAG